MLNFTFFLDNREKILIIVFGTFSKENLNGGETMYEELKKLLVDELLIAPEDITLEAELANDLGISSVDLADLICNCEDKFGIEIDDTDMTKFVTVGDVVAYLEEKKK